MLYKSRGHKMETLEFDSRDNLVHTILADNEFYALKEDLENEGVMVWMKKNIKRKKMK